MNQLKIHGCQDCGYCTGPGKGKCFQKDGMTEVMAALKDADALVLASPIYYFTMTGQMQCTIQRLYPLFSQLFHVKETALILSSGADDVYEPAIRQYHSIFTEWMDLPDKGCLTAHGSENKSEAKEKEAYRLGYSMK